MSNTVFAPLIAYRARLIDIMNHDEVWNDGRCARVFDANNAWGLLEAIKSGDFTPEQKSLARKIEDNMNQLDGLMDHIADLIYAIAENDIETKAA